MKNMSPREKKLALFVGVVGGLVFTFIGWQWYSQGVRQKKAAIANLERELSGMETTQALHRVSKNRERDYAAKSLPGEPQKANSEYRAWLLKLASEHIGLTDTDVAAGASREEKSPQGVIYKTGRMDVKGQGTLLQIVQLLDEYYAADFIHRMERFSIVPVATKGQGSDKRDNLQLSFTTEALLLPGVESRPEDAPERSPWRAPELAVASHRELLTRDPFNPGSDLPSVRTSGGRRFYLGEAIELSLSGSDDDLLNQLKFELDEASLPEELRGKIKLTQEGEAEALLAAEPLAEGNYRFKVRVTDNGLPPEQVEEEVSFSVEERVVRQTPTEVKPEPKLVDFAEFSTITAVLRDVRGRPLVWINVKPEGEIYELTIGDEFEIGSVHGVVEQIEGRSVTVLVDGERFRYVTGDVLAEPEIITAVSAVDDGD